MHSIDAVWNRIGKGRIKQIKKAEKNGLYVDVYGPGKVNDDCLNLGYDIIKSVYQHAKLPLVGIEQVHAMNRQELLVLFVVRDVAGNMLGCRFGLLYNNSTTIDRGVNYSYCINCTN